MSFSSLDLYILISSFQKILSPFSNYPPLKTFEVWNCENMENTFVVVNFYLVSFSFKFHEDLYLNARARVINAHTRDKTCAHAFTTRAQAFMHESSWNLKLKLTRWYLTTTQNFNLNGKLGHWGPTQPI